MYGTVPRYGHMHLVLSKHSWTFHGFQWLSSNAAHSALQLRTSILASGKEVAAHPAEALAGPGHDQSSTGPFLVIRVALKLAVKA